MSKSNTDYENISKAMLDLMNVYSNDYYIRIDACNDFVLPANWDFKNRVNTNFHLAYVRRGRGSYRYGKPQYIDEVKKGKLYFFSKHCCHSRELDEKDLPHMILMRFDMVNRYTGQEVQVTNPFAFSMQDYQGKYSKMLTDIVYNYQHAQKKFSKRIAFNILEQLLYEIVNDALIKQNPKPADKRIMKTIDYMHTNLGRNISIDELCKHANLSKNYYRKLFFNQFGLYPKAFMIRMRLEQAEYLLVETDYTIKKISEMLGYSDAYSFSKQYKEKTGFSPLKYRLYMKCKQ